MLTPRALFGGRSCGVCQTSTSNDGGVCKECVKLITSRATQGGAWRVGQRVVTRVDLAGLGKAEHKAGAAGTVWHVFADGVMRIRLDAPAPSCDYVVAVAAPAMVDAEPRDVLRLPMLPKKAAVWCDRVELALRDRRTLIPHGTMGVVSEYNAREDAYKVKIGSKKLYAHIPASMVTPVSRPPAPQGVLDLIVSQCVEAAAPALPEELFSREGSSLSSQLSRQPSYSNLSGSPKARGVRRRSTFTSSVKFCTSYQSDEGAPVSCSPSSFSGASWTDSVDNADESMRGGHPRRLSDLLPRALRHRNSV